MKYLDELLAMIEACVMRGVVITNDSNEAMITALSTRADECLARAQSIQDLADSEERALTDEEASEIDRLIDESEAAIKNVKRRQRMQNASNGMQQPAPTRSDSGVEIGNATHVDLPGQHSGNLGFRNMGEFATQVFLASKAMRNGTPHTIDTRLTNVTSGSNEGTDSEGGFAVPPDFREEIQRIVTGEGSLYSRADDYTTARNEIKFPKDETTPWNTTGIQARWKAELAQATQDKVDLKEHTITLHNLICLAPVSDELLEDAPAVGSYLSRKAPEVIDFKLTDSLMNGTGTGQPEGVLTSAAGIVIPKETAQVADTIVFENTVKMLARLPMRYWGSAAWQMPQTALPQLMNMEFPGDSSSVFLRGNNAAGRPFDTLHGFPIVYSEAAPQLGDEGDISLVGWNQYSVASKVGGVRQAISMHLFFDWMATAFRFNLRVGGKNWLDAAYVSNDGSTTYSNIVKLAARA